MKKGGQLKNFKGSTSISYFASKLTGKLYKKNTGFMKSSLLQRKLRCCSIQRSSIRLVLHALKMANGLLLSEV